MSEGSGMNERRSRRWLTSGMVQMGLKGSDLSGSLLLRIIIAMTGLVLAVIFLLPFVVGPE